MKTEKTDAQREWERLASNLDSKDYYSILSQAIWELPRIKTTNAQQIDYYLDGGGFVGIYERAIEILNEKRSKK